MRVLTLGTFDTLHSGHLGLFRQCRRLAGLDGTVVVAVNTDAFVEKYKHRTPLIPFKVRSDVIGELSTVDEVFANYGDAAQPDLIDRVAPDVIVIGEDWAKNNYLTQIGVTQQWLDERNIQLCYVPRTGDWSSTALQFSWVGENGPEAAISAGQFGGFNASVRREPPYDDPPIPAPMT